MSCSSRTRRTRDPHDEQLKRYQTLVLEGKTALGQVAWDDLFPIYVRTGNYSLKDRRHAESESYRVFDRNDFLGILDEYSGTNAILIDFRDHLSRWRKETDSFHSWTRNGCRSSRGWEGFYRHIENTELADSDDEWGPLKTRVGTYWGIWIKPKEAGGNRSFAIWIEKDTISFRLYGAEDWTVSVSGMNREKENWANAFVGGYPGRLRRPRRLVATKTMPMRVAEWPNWLAFCDEGQLDLAKTLGNLTAAKEMLLDTIRRT